MYSFKIMSVLYCRPRLESTSSEDNGTTITAEDLEHSALQQPLKHFYFYQGKVPKLSNISCYYSDHESEFM